jgi:hypothetical protein
VTRRIRTASRYWNDEGKLVSLSGHAYVPGKVRGYDEPWVPMIIRTPARCEEHTICVYCVEDWLWDWEIAFARTAGGRALMTRCVAEGIDLDSWVRWNANAPTPDDIARASANRARCASH